MPATSPHYLLYSEVQPADVDGPQWRFVLQSLAGDNRLVAADSESNMHRSRLELLAVVRGLEALAQPSRVTLLTGSRYVSRGLRRGLSQWREREWRWERFGELVPIRDQDLWRRVDRALEFHRVECCPVPRTDAAERGGQGTGVDGISDSRHDRAADAASPEVIRPVVESAMLVVPHRPSSRAATQGGPHGRISWTLNSLRQSVLAPLAAIWRPAFTRAA